MLDNKERTRVQAQPIAELCGDKVFGELSKKNQGKELRKYFFKALLKTINALERLDESSISSIRTFILKEDNFHKNPPRQWFGYGEPRYSVDGKATNKSTKLAIDFLDALSIYVTKYEKYSQVKTSFQLLKDNYPADFIPNLDVTNKIKSKIQMKAEPEIGISKVIGQTFSGSRKNKKLVEESCRKALSPIFEEAGQNKVPGK